MSYLPAGWSVRAVADNALATATKAAEPGKSHIIYAVSASFSVAAAGKLLEIKDGTGVIWSAYVHNSLPLVFPRGLVITNGAACSVELAAAGSGGQIGAVSLHGVTV